MRAVRVRVPATSANLGPAFDSGAIALTLYDEVVVRVVDAGLQVEVGGEGAGELATDETNLVIRSMTAMFDKLGEPLPGLHVTCANRIPQSRGLGSSAGAICAGLLAARALSGGEAGFDDRSLAAYAAQLEGHGDNVTACLRGGATIAWGAGEAAEVEVAADVVAVAFVPALRASTVAARGLLPASVPHGDAAANAARAALLPLALSGDPDLLLAATEDWLHQRYRASAMPQSVALVDSLRADGVAAVLSGAGPSVLALARRAGAPMLAARAPAEWAALLLEVDREGAVVTAA